MKNAKSIIIITIILSLICSVQAQDFQFAD